MAILAARVVMMTVYIYHSTVAVMLAFMMRGDGEPDTKAFVFATPASLSPSLADAASQFTQV